MQITPPRVPRPPSAGGRDPSGPGAGRYRHLRSLVGRRRIVCGAATVALTGWAAARYGVEAAGFAAGSSVLVWLLVPHVGRFARRIEVVARPGGRAVHRRITPLLGGAAVLLPLVLALGWWSAQGSRQALGLLGAVVLLAAVGFADDAWSLRARTKLGFQAAAAGLLLWGGFRLETVDLPPFGPWALGWLEAPLLLVWVIGVTNAFNMVDGIDGLAATMAFVAAVFAAAAGAHPLLAMAVAGASVGFLRHNLPRASIFLGDTGSLVLGICVAALTLELPVRNNAAMAVGLVAYPVGDVALSIVRRMLRAKPPFTADRSHVHHKILAHNGSPVRTVLGLFGFAVLLAALSRLLPGPWALLALGSLWALLALMVVRHCNVRVRTMWAHRHQFRRIHALRRGVLSLLESAGSRAEVHRALHLVPPELDLAALEFGESRIARVPDREGRVQRVVVRLRRGEAAWEYVPRASDPTLDHELHGVLGELLRVADRRLAQMAAAHPSPRVAAPAEPPEPPRAAALRAAAGS